MSTRIFSSDHNDGTFPHVNSPALLALELVDRAQDVTESSSRLEVQETLGLNVEEQQ